MTQPRFGTAINCIDGRAQAPVWDWLRSYCNVHYVDLITEAGADELLSQGPAEAIEAIRNKVKFTVDAHSPSVIAVVGHHDCLKNAVSDEEHWEDIKRAVSVVASWEMGVRVVGLFVTDHMAIRLITDTDENSKIQQ
jgi:carbonic anhydrase-like protein